MKREFGLDSLRIIAAFFIISHHIEYQSVYYLKAIYLAGGSWALFYFFFISGYFLSYKGILTERSIKTISRIISISLIWSAIYLTLNIWDYGLVEGIKFYLTYFLTNYYHLWFLIALVVGFIFLNFFESLNIGRYKLWVSIIIILYAYATIKQVRFPNLLPFTLPKNLIDYFIGIPCIFYGNYLAKNPPLKINLCIILIIIGLIIIFFEGLFLGFNMHYLGTIPLVIGVVNLGLNKPKFLDWGKLSTYGGRYGLGIYLIHPYIIYVIGRLKTSYNIYFEGRIYETILPFFIIFISALTFHLCYLILPKVYKALTGNQKKITV